MRIQLTVLLAGILLLSCSSPKDRPSLPELGVTPAPIISLLGDTLNADLPDETGPLQADLDSALIQFETYPSADNLIWVGRRLGYLSRFADAIAVFSNGIDTYPDDARVLRHRGHRYVSTRKFDQAVADFEKAAELIEGTADEIEPDGAPNAAGIPVSTLHFNIWYHLGLAQYLLGNYNEALTAYRACMAASDNNDSRAATADWMYMTLRRLGRHAEADEVLVPFSAETQLVENQSYLRRILLYKGELTPDELLSPEGATALDLATQGYGVANWYLAEGDTTRAASLFEEIIAGSYWSAFGYIAAEADLARLKD